MSAPDVEALVKRADKAWQRKANFLSLMRDVYDYAMPERNAFANFAEGQKRNLKVFDSTAIVGTSRFANRICATVFPPMQRWALLEPGSAVPAQWRQRIAARLEEDTDKLFAAIHASNFDTAVNEMAHDLCAGTGVLLGENGRLGGRKTGPALRWTAVPSAHVAFEEGPFGAIEAIFHCYKPAARNVERTYPDGTVPDAIKKKATEDPDAEIELLQATYYDADEDCWWFDVVHKESKSRIVKRKYRTNPWIVLRWLKAPGEIEGRGPLVQALPDIKTLNKVVELVLKNASLAVSGVYTAVDDGVINPSTVRIAPGAVIPVASNGGARGPSLAPLQRAGDFNIAELVIDKLQMTIKKILFDNQLPPETGSVRSPTEIVARMQELAQDIGAAFGRLNSDGVLPIVARALDILDELGELVIPLKVDRFEINVRAVSPLAKAQNLEDVQVITDYLTVTAPLGPQAVAAGLKVDQAAPYIAEKLGVPASLIPTEEDRAAAAEAMNRAATVETIATSPVAARVLDNLTKPQARAA